MNRHQRLLSVAAGVLALWLASLQAAAAAPLTADECATAAGVPVAVATAISPSQNITLFAIGSGGSAPPFVGSAQVRVFCRLATDPFTDLGDLKDVTVAVSVTDAATTPDATFLVSGPGVTTPAPTVLLGPFDGTATFTVYSDNPDLASGNPQPVATFNEAVVSVGGIPLLGAGAAIGTSGAVFASPGGAAGTTVSIFSVASCLDASGTPMLLATGLSPGGNILLVAPTSAGPFTGQGKITAYCQLPVDPFTILGELQDVTIVATVAPTGAPGATFAITGTGSPDPGANPAIIGPFTGTTVFTLTSPTPSLEAATQPIAIHVELLNTVGTTPILGSGVVQGAFGSVYAQTPELGSLALFGTGALGMAGYALARLRARRRSG